VKNLLIIAILGGAFAVHAADPPAELLFHKTFVEFTGNKVITEHYYDIRINEPEGASYGEVVMPYSDISKISAISAVILDRNGRKVRTIRKSEMTDRSAISSISFYEDEYYKEFNAKHNVYPYRVVYSYTSVEKEFITLVNWVPVLDPEVPTLDAELVVEVPAETQIRYGGREIVDPAVVENGPTTTYTWKASYEQQNEDNILTPHFTEMYPWLRVIPVEFSFDKPGSSSSWTEFGDWVCDINEGMDELPEAEKMKIDRVIVGDTDDLEKIRKLYRRLQDETRYVSISFETGGYKPYPASYVAEKKYGDCKALTNYFKSVLAYSGIDSYYTLVYAGEKHLAVDTSMVCPQFNHAILMVPVNGDTLWLDCTTKRPFGNIGSSIQDRLALATKRGKSRFVWIPPMQES